MCVHMGIFQENHSSPRWGGVGHRPFLMTGFVSPEVNRLLRLFFLIVTIILSKKIFSLRKEKNFSVYSETSYPIQ